MKKCLYLLLFVSHIAFTQTSLPVSTPEAEGVSSAAINSFLTAMSNSKHELHGFVFLRHGKVIADAWAKPYADSLKHTMYSTSKSFTSTAIGFAVSEQKIKVTDKVISFFPDQVPAEASEFLKALTIRDLLTMTVGHPKDPTGDIFGKTDWVRSFLALPITDTPGTKFLYNSMATFMLSAIVQKVTGQKVIDYLEPRLFKPLGIVNKDWETNPEGINTGGWGLRITANDMAKFGQLYLQKGKWNGRQLLPESWVQEASTAHIQQNPKANAAERAKSDDMQGYGYQFWRSRFNSYRADGAFGQYILIFPELDAVIAFSSESPAMRDELNVVWQHLYPGIKKNALPANPNAVSALEKTESSLGIRPFKVAADSANIMITPAPITATSFKLKKNQKGLDSISFDIKKETITITLNGSANTAPLIFGRQEWVYNITDLKPPALTAGAANSLKGLPAFKVAGRFRWKDKNTVELILQYVESAHHESWTCYFKDGTFKLEVRNSIMTMNGDRIDETILQQ